MLLFLEFGWSRVTFGYVTHHEAEPWRQQRAIANVSGVKFRWRSCAIVVKALEEQVYLRHRYQYAAGTHADLGAKSESSRSKMKELYPRLFSTPVA